MKARDPSLNSVTMTQVGVWTACRLVTVTPYSTPSWKTCGSAPCAVVRREYSSSLAPAGLPACAAPVPDGAVGGEQVVPFDRAGVGCR